jgi:hypothetical protein
MAEPHAPDAAEAGSSLPGLPSTPQIDTAVAHSARVWDYWLGGKDNYPVDRAVGDQIAQVLPGILTCAQAGRLFLSRVVRFLAGKVGIRQFLDIGAGLPTFEDNTHEVAQRAAPECRVVYVDNDPLVVVHARALQASSPEGAIDVVRADLRDPADVLAGAARTLDLRQPAAVLLLGVLWHVLDDGEAATIIARLMGPLAAGSYLAVEHPTLEVTGPKMAEAIALWNTHGTPPGTHRTPQQLQRLLGGLDLAGPGIVPCTRWRPEASPFGEPAPVDAYCAVGRTPPPAAQPRGP